MKTKLKQTETLARLIWRRILGTIEADEAALLDEWRKASPENEATYRRLMDTAFLEREWRRNVRRFLRNWGRVGVAAAVVLGFVIGGVLYFRPQEPQALPVLPETVQYAGQIRHGETKAVLTRDDGTVVNLGADAARNEEAMKRSPKKAQSVAPEAPKFNLLATPRGGEFEITLVDGTKVWLNAESQLSYPETFRADERRVVLKGEAYFQVARNEEKPFYVETDGQIVRVYGTEFNVRSYEEDAAVYTTLVSGSVALQPEGGSNAELFLTPGHQAVFDKGDASTFVRAVDTETVTGWRKGMFVFEEQNLGQIMATLGRWYNFEYEFTDNVLTETVFKGSVPRYGDFNEVLEILEKSGGLKFRVRERTVTVAPR